MKNPWTKFFWRDWQSDTSVRSCSIAARGLWVEMLCIMAQNDARYGYLEINSQPISSDKLARAACIDSVECCKLLAELETAGVFSRDGDFIFCRRLVRDAKKRDDGKKTGGLHKNNLNTNNHIPYAICQSDPKAPPAIDPKGTSEAPPQGQLTNLSINPPTLADCHAAARTIGMKPEQVEAFFHHYNAQGWVKKGGQAIRNLSSALATWKANDSRFRSSNGKPAEQTTPDWKKLEILKDQVSKFTAQNPHPDRWTDTQRNELKTKRAEIKRLEGEMVK